MDTLPLWDQGTPAILCVAGPHPIPVSTAVRAGDDRVLFALGRKRDTLQFLRDDSRAAFRRDAEQFFLSVAAQP